MKYNFVGSSGLKVSSLCLGTNNFGGRLDFDQSALVLDAALASGVNFIDTSDTYANGKSEEFLGRALGKRRGEVVIATKFGNGFPDGPRASRHHVITAVDNSLKRLGTDYIDLLQLHRPDPNTPMQETLRALEDVVRQGKVRYIGSSNFRAWNLVEAHWVAKSLGSTEFISSQEEYSLVRRGIESELLPVMRRYGTGLVAYAPLARGMLSGKYERNQAPLPETRLAKTPKFQGRYFTKENFDIVDRLRTYAGDIGKGMVDLSLSWLTHQSAVTSVIVGAMSPAQVESHVAGVSMELSETELSHLDEISAPPAKAEVLVG